MSILSKSNDQKPSVKKVNTALQDILAPKIVETDFANIKVGDKYFRTYFVNGYPRYVSSNWLQPLVDFNHELNISFFIYPSDSAEVLNDIQHKIAELEATISSDTDNGKPIDPKVTATLEDALSVQQELAKGIEKFFHLGLYITVISPTLAELNLTSKQLTTTLGSLLIATQPTTLQMEEGFKSTMPYGFDRIVQTRNMDTTSLSSTFPFSSATLTQNKGVLYGLNEQNASLVVFDRFSMENANETVFGKSGSGKSYLIKLEILRTFMFGTEVMVIDPENEYEPVAKTLGGEYVAFSAASAVKINPFDLSGVREEDTNELGEKILSLHALLKIALGDIPPVMDAILDRAIIETYHNKGITQDPSTQTKTPPLMEDLYNTLLAMKEPQAQELAIRMERFTRGSLSGFFSQQSNFNITNQLTVFSIRDVEDELRPIIMHIILDFIWTRVRRTLKKRLLIVDEAWYLMRYEDSASFIYSIAKRGRKYFLGLTTATQDVADFLSTQYGKAVLSNSSIQILLKQSTTEVDEVTKIFYLSQSERQLLVSAEVGEGLFFAGQNHVAIRVVAADFEHKIITSRPEDIIQNAADVLSSTTTPTA